VLRTSDDTAQLPDRCADWARRIGAEVEVIGPLGLRDLRTRMGFGPYAGAVLELPRVMDDDALATAIARAEFPVVAVSRGELTGERSIVEAVCATALSGRGTSGFLWALWHLHALHEHPPRTLSYGDHPTHLGDLRVPDGADHAAIVALIHGGFWRHEWQRDLMDGLALDLTRRGYATWNVEYRRVGPTGGGWPHTGDDVVRAATSLAILADRGIDLDRLVLLGHSAGAQLALRAAVDLRERPRPPALVVAMSGMLDLRTAVRQGVGWGSVEAFLGADPDEEPARYRDAAPITSVPLGVPQLLVHGTADEHVPYAQSETYRERATAAGDPVELVPLQEADHFGVIDPLSEAWATTAAALERHVPAS